MKYFLKSATPILGIAILFLISAYVVQTNEQFFVDLIGAKSVIGIVIYVLLAITTTVVAPLSSIPLMPIASNVWGALITAIASIIGWWIGSLIAFYISRTYGKALVEKLVAKEKLLEFEKRVPVKNIFWSIVLLRMALPVDVLSYVLGLFSNISWYTYAFASLLGIIPFAFVFAYVGVLPFLYQMVAILISAIVIIFILKKGIKKIA
jgi:uncharacterized membrane protein YdjX (TVP38/TMEM64 family)